MTADATPATAPRGRALVILTVLLGAWRSLVARTVRVGEVRGSNPRAPIEKSALSRPHPRGRLVCFQDARLARARRRVPHREVDRLAPEDDVTQIGIDWKTAEAHEQSLTVSLEPAPSTDWRKRFRAVATQLEHTERRWGSIAVKKDRITVGSVAAGAEDDVRHHLESIVLQANAGEGEERGGDEQPAGPDERMTDVFRAFAAGDGPDAA